jgi:hypothetical protein
MSWWFGISKGEDIPQLQQVKLLPKTLIAFVLQNPVDRTISWIIATI